ncbi:hypothetical protein D1007_26760 [Hordeum vulgare]|nr:hypothetical protein D1007_26760 [Hordeum vulgare]
MGRWPAVRRRAGRPVLARRGEIDVVEAGLAEEGQTEVRASAGGRGGRGGPKEEGPDLNRDMYPKGSPKYNLMKVAGKKASHGAKKLTPKIKKTTPKGHIAEGNYNFTSIEATQVIDDDPEVERDETGFSFDLNQCEDDLLMYDDPRDAAQSDDPSGAIQSDDPIDGTQSDVTRAGALGGSNKKLVKEPKKKKRDDPMVEVMENYVEIKRKQAEEESALFAESKNAQQFTITKCIAVLHSHGERAAAYKVFKNAENREIFLNAAAEDEVSAAVFLRSEMADLPRGTSPESSPFYPETPSSHGLPKAATKSRKKLNYHEEDSNFVPEVPTPEKQKEKSAVKKTVTKEYSKP